MKMKRNIAKKHFEKEIADMYALPPLVPPKKK